MSFNRTFEYIIQKNDRSFINLTFNNNDIELNTFNSKYEYIKSVSLIKGSYSFVDIDFDINNKDKIFGVLNDKINCLYYLSFSERFLTRTPVINYCHENLAIKFPTIKCNDYDTNIFCYLIDKNKKKYCELIHIIKSETDWKYNVIDRINFGILSNFVTITLKNLIYIFYYKRIKNYEEIFMSTYDSSTHKWSIPIQLTNTHNSKVYLSVLEYKNCFHIAFSENIDNKYFCNYINLSIDNNIVNTNNYMVLSDNVACTFPHIIQNNNILFTQWIEYNDLFTSYSADNGNSWCLPKVSSKAQDYTFVRSIIKSNYLKKQGIYISTMFSLKNSPVPLGIKIL